MTRLIVAGFASNADTMAAARAAAERGFPAVDALAPHPLEGIGLCLTAPKHRSPIGWVMFIAGVVGGVIGYGMQWFSAVIDYPIISGGRGLNSWPAFLLVPYETTILAAGVIGTLGLIWMCGLPRLFHPLFEAKATTRAVQDAYALVFSDGPGQRAKVEALKPRTITEVDA